MAEATRRVTRRRVGVALDTSGAGDALLEILETLLAGEVELDVEAVLLQEDAERMAAALPGVREYGVLTARSREISSLGYARAVERRRQRLEQALRKTLRRDDLAVPVKFVKRVVSMLRDMAQAGDITVFMPPSRAGQGLLPQHARRRRRRRVAVIVDTVAQCSEAIGVAIQIASGDVGSVSVIETAAAVDNSASPEAAVTPKIPSANIRRAPDRYLESVIDVVHTTRAQAVVLSVTHDQVSDEMIDILRQRLRCPVCLVRSAHSAETQGKG